MKWALEALGGTGEAVSVIVVVGASRLDVGRK